MPLLCQTAVAAAAWHTPPPNPVVGQLTRRPSLCLLYLVAHAQFPLRLETTTRLFWRLVAHRGGRGSISHAKCQVPPSLPLPLGGDFSIPQKISDP